MNAHEKIAGQHRTDALVAAAVPPIAVSDLVVALRDQGFAELITEDQATALLRRYGFLRPTGNNPRRMVALSNVAADLARRLNAA